MTTLRIVLLSAVRTGGLSKMERMPLEGGSGASVAHCWAFLCAGGKNSTITWVCSKGQCHRDAPGGAGLWHLAWTPGIQVCFSKDSQCAFPSRGCGAQLAHLGLKVNVFFKVCILPVWLPTLGLEATNTLREQGWVEGNQVAQDCACDPDPHLAGCSPMASPNHHSLPWLTQAIDRS